MATLSASRRNSNSSNLSISPKAGIPNIKLLCLKEESTENNVITSKNIEKCTEKSNIDQYKDDFNNSNELLKSKKERTSSDQPALYHCELIGQCSIDKNVFFKSFTKADDVQLKKSNSVHSDTNTLDTDLEESNISSDPLNIGKYCMYRMYGCVYKYIYQFPITVSFQLMFSYFVFFLWNKE